MASPRKKYDQLDGDKTNGYKHPEQQYSLSRVDNGAGGATGMKSSPYSLRESLYRTIGTSNVDLPNVRLGRTLTGIYSQQTGEITLYRTHKNLSLDADEQFKYVHGTLFSSEKDEKGEHPVVEDIPEKQLLQGMYHNDVYGGNYLPGNLTLVAKNKTLSSHEVLVHLKLDTPLEAEVKDISDYTGFTVMTTARGVSCFTWDYSYPGQQVKTAEMPVEQQEAVRGIIYAWDIENLKQECLKQISQQAHYVSTQRVEIDIPQQDLLAISAGLKELRAMITDANNKNKPLHQLVEEFKKTPGGQAVYKKYEPRSSLDTFTDNLAMYMAESKKLQPSFTDEQIQKIRALRAEFSKEIDSKINTASAARREDLRNIAKRLLEGYQSIYSILGEYAFSHASFASDYHSIDFKGGLVWLRDFASRSSEIESELNIPLPKKTKIGLCVAADYQFDEEKREVVLTLTALPSHIADTLIQEIRTVFRAEESDDKSSESQAQKSSPLLFGSAAPHPDFSIKQAGSPPTVEIRTKNAEAHEKIFSVLQQSEHVFVQDLHVPYESYKIAFAKLQHQYEIKLIEAAQDCKVEGPDGLKELLAEMATLKMKVDINACRHDTVQYEGPPKIYYQTPLLVFAIEHSSRKKAEKAVHFLLECGADINAPASFDGRTALTVASLPHFKREALLVDKKKEEIAKPADKLTESPRRKPTP